MDLNREIVMARVFELLNQLASDWDYGQEITMDSYLFRDLGFQSLDAVVLGNELQQRFNQPIPYADLLEAIGAKENNDVTVEEWIDFTYKYLNNTPESRL